MPRKVFVAGEILTASDVNTNLMDQSVMVFDDATARATAIPTPVEGMVTYLEDVGGAQGLEVFDGAAFVNVNTDSGKILQVVSVAKTDVFSTTSQTFVDVTGLTLSITPTSTSSKVLVFANISMNASASQGFAIARAGSPILLGDADGSRQRVTGAPGAAELAGVVSPSALFLDSPATTSAVTYSIQVSRGEEGTCFVNRPQDNSDRFNRKRAASTLTLMEVAG